MKQPRLLNCPICNELIGDNQRTVNISFGFGDSSPVLTELLFHRRCTEGIDCVRYMLDYFEMENEE